jgi:hypothetical protein
MEEELERVQREALMDRFSLPVFVGREPIKPLIT